MYACFNSRALKLGPLDAREAIRLAAEAGFEGIDLLVRDIVDSESNPYEIRARMEDANLRGGAWTFPYDWRADEESYQKGLDRLPAYARAAQILGLQRTGTWVLPTLPEHMSSLDELADWHLKRLSPIARILADYGIHLGIETIAVQTAPFQDTGPIFARRLSDVNLRLRSLRDRHSNVGLLWDSFHAALASDEQDASRIWGVDRIVWVHIANPPRMPAAERRLLRDDQREWPDQGETRYSLTILKQLRQAGYDGPVTPEPSGAGAPISRNPQIQGVRASLACIWPTTAEA